MSGSVRVVAVAAGCRPRPRPIRRITGDPEADQLLMDEPLALLLGMLLDQQVPMEWAFKGPATLKSRLGDALDAHAIAAMSPTRSSPCSARSRPCTASRRPWPGGSTALCEILVDNTTATPAPSGATSAPATSSTAGCASCPATARRRPRSSWPSWPSGSARRPTGWEEVAGAVLRQARPARSPTSSSPPSAGQGAGVQEGAEGRGQGQGRLTVGAAPVSRRR